MTNYVLGFAFDENERVALILKSKPDWQSGKLNGIGGKVEADEAAIEAMVREFKEETGYQSTVDDWKFVGYIGTEDYEMDIFTSYSIPLDELKTTTNEPVMIKSIRETYHLEMVKNLRFLIPFAYQFKDLDYTIMLGAE